MTAIPHSASRMAAKYACSSSDSGVVREAGTTRSPKSYSTVPIMPQRFPAAANRWRSRKATDVFPLVPVTPSSFS